MDPKTTIFLLCDIQTKFRPAIYGFDQVVATANKLVKLAEIMGCEVISTTQNSRALGPIDPGIDLGPLASLHLGPYDKTLFSMITPQVQQELDQRPYLKTVVLFGIEAHICILQTTLSLKNMGRLTTYIVADGISSANSFEIPIALNRLRAEGAVISTSESIAFELVKDAAGPEFRQLSRVIKQEKQSTRISGEVLLNGKEPLADNSKL